MALFVACSPNPNGQGVAEFGSVQGRVVEAKNPSQPIGTFTVAIGGQSVSVSPAAQGAFKVDHVPTGTQTITISSPGYTSYSAQVIVRKGQTTELGLIGLASTTGL